ncbi:TetR family transcriptional regulator [Nocardiopsis sp. CNR-923]|uniref:TetR/AcrR family transcriptional regulator n=1 Tax=Nocardiopsis sp. CNR-923 TaxID=1904965 RepID=UPI0009673A87|nr:TetR/AcrR family transcriptional regulator [Nocardiopsis sp. CNR-923]OLT29929.1 TetR family transcriptional regulator [Nocardiopsis sp. CNR-923]
MPRTADHALRRAQISRAVREMIAETGLDTVTVSRTAARAGMSVGLVQHYFRAKDDMLLHAFQEVSTEVAERVAGVVREGATHRRTIADVLLDALAEHLPLDEPRRAEFRVVRAFAGRALDSPALAEVDARTAEATHAEIARAVRNGAECGEVGPDVDADTAATRIASVAEGLATRVYRGAPGVADHARAALRAELGTVFTGRCRQYEG